MSANQSPLRWLLALVLPAATAVSRGDEGAATHWAFTPPANPQLPQVADPGWAQRPLDHFVLAKLEPAGIIPAPRARRRQLLRRAYIDLIGLPPTPDEVQAFLDDGSPEAFSKVIDVLLASPRYGERWGRHWLDVARYGDSNGGDENHAYPHAWRYRDYVIDAFNRDLPYDQFVAEQLAGDLIEGGADDLPRRLTATGFLAIGTKILAEKDPVKKLADTIDEQIDTLSRALMAMSVACSRCHDHKFDPIPTRDYYALAGILRSTEIADLPLRTTGDAEGEAKRAEALATIDEQLASARGDFGSLADDQQKIEWEAETFSRGNVVVDSDNYGKGIGIISDPGGQDNFAEYDIDIAEPGVYLLELRYAAAASRPGRLLIDGDANFALPVLAGVTGGWMPENQRWIHEGHLQLTGGEHVLRVESKPLMSHLDKIRLTPVRDLAEAQAELAEIGALEKRRAELVAAKVEPAKAMAVRDGEVADAKVNLRGDPHDLGDAVPRGFLSVIGGELDCAAPGDRSGRLELARWLTDPRHPLTARVMVNRVWRWHFGKGIVASVDDFGTTGTAPSHPQLLDHLASHFVRGGWSTKALHREIMLSSTYQMAVGHPDRSALERDPDNALYSRRDVRRVEAEVFRDAVLSVAGSLERTPPESPLVVKSQDPSPADLADNRAAYEGFPHRSVYLPVVRSHLYDLLTLLGFPNATTTVGDRAQTTVPTQALLMLNSPFLIAQAEKLAARFGQGELDRLYLTLFARPPDAEENAWAEEFLARYAELQGAEKAWSTLCHTLLISDEFLHVW